MSVAAAFLTATKCPECEGDVSTSFEISTTETVEADSDGEQRWTVVIKLVSVEIVGGCEHAEDARERITFKVE